jgi:hypothetical protein
MQVRALAGARSSFGPCYDVNGSHSSWTQLRVKAKTALCTSASGDSADRRPHTASGPRTPSTASSPIRTSGTVSLISIRFLCGAARPMTPDNRWKRQRPAAAQRCQSRWPVGARPPLRRSSQPLLTRFSPNPNLRAPPPQAPPGSMVTSRGVSGRRARPWLWFSWMKMANRMRSMEVRSWKVPIGRVRLRTSRKRHSMALVVGTALRASRVG